MTEEFTCPCCEAEMTLRSDKNAVFQKDGLSVKYERIYMACDKCGEESQTNAQATASTRNALEAWYNKRETLGALCLFALMAIVLTSVFIRCS